MRALAQLPHAFAAALCLGLALSVAMRMPLALAAGFGGCGVVVALACRGVARSCAVLAAVAALGWAWGGARLETLDRSVLAAHVGTGARARLVITGTPRRGEYEVRVAATVVEWAAARIREPVLLKLPKGRAPPQGAVVELVGELREPRSGDEFDERTWLRRHGVHVVVRAAEWNLVGRRGGILGVADRIRARVARSIAPGLHGDRRALLQGIVLGDDGDLSQRVRDSFRASGLYHLLAVSGQNVALVAAGALELSWLVGIGRLGGEVGALAAIVAYVLAVGAQPSVVRAGIAGALGSLAWLTARMRDRWYFLLLAGVALLAWNPYTLLDPGFQLSFAAVAAIFVLAPRIERSLDGYPLPPALRVVVAISAACALATAPISWLHFHSLALLTLVANVLAAPAVAPLLALGLAAAVVTPISAGAAAAIAWLNGWCAAYVIACATFIGSLPGAQIRSTRALLVVIAGALLTTAYACPGVSARPLVIHPAGEDGQAGRAGVACLRRRRLGA